MDPYPFKTPPYDYQRKALRFLWKNRWGGGLLMEPGTGKTKVALDFAGALYLYKGIRRVLVVCPVAAFGVWEREAQRHVPPDVPYTHTRIHKTKSMQKLYEDVHPACLQIVVINYETARQPLVIKQLLHWLPELVILDESHKIKKSTAKRSRACHRLGRVAAYRMILTGTAITNSPLDIFSQWKFLNPQRFGYSFSDFKEQYAIVGGYGGYEVLGYKNKSVMERRMGQDAFVALKKDCLDLPEKVHQVVPVYLSPSTEKIYRQMERRMVAELDEETRVIAPIVLTKLLRLSQITSGFVTDEKEVSILGKEKLDTIAELIEDYCLYPEKKIVIFSRFIPSLERIADLLTEMKVPFSVIRGGISQKNREEAQRQIWEAKGAAVLLGQLEAAGLAIDLSCCATAIFYELDYSSDHYIQAQDRLHRLGQRNPVLYLYPEVTDTVDEDIHSALDTNTFTAANILEKLRYRAKVKVA